MNNPNQWCFPGGSSKKHSNKKLARKESFEEVGITPKKLKLVLDVYTNKKIYNFYIVYLKDDINIDINHESSKYKWVKINSLKKHKNKHKSIRVFLRHFKN